MPPILEAPNKPPVAEYLWSGAFAPERLPYHQDRWAHETSKRQQSHSEVGDVDGVKYSHS